MSPQSPHPNLVALALLINYHSNFSYSQSLEAIFQTQVQEINNELALCIFEQTSQHKKLVMVSHFEFDNNNQVVNIRNILNPNKLTHIKDISTCE